ncbi:MAG: hypothetical protein KGN02_10975 [bacterium]|nr:hypothetical protein [bacterium]
MLSMVFAVLFAQSYAPTPQAAALAAMRHTAAPASVQRTNVVGRYATVLTKGGRMEGATVTSPLLLERFAFGWQPLELLNFRCRIDAHALGASVDERLMRGMPRAHDDRPCGTRGMLRDAGPAREVEAVRAIMRGPLVPAVVVVGTWALGDWYGAGGGESLYRKSDGAWHLVTGGGGAMSVFDMRKYGVPASAWCAFGIYDARCARASSAPHG